MGKNDNNIHHQTSLVDNTTLRRLGELEELCETIRRLAERGELADHPVYDAVQSARAHLTDAARLARAIAAAQNGKQGRATRILTGYDSDVLAKRV